MISLLIIDYAKRINETALRYIWIIESRWTRSGRSCAWFLIGNRTIVTYLDQSISSIKHMVALHSLQLIFDIARTNVYARISQTDSPIRKQASRELSIKCTHYLFRMHNRTLNISGLREITIGIFGSSFFSLFLSLPLSRTLHRI